MQIAAALDLTVQVEHARSAWHVTASTREPSAALAVAITFSGGADGTWFRTSQAGKSRVFSSQVIASHPALGAVLRLIADEIELSKRPDPALLSPLIQALLIYTSRMTTLLPLPHWGRPVRHRRIEKALRLLHADLSKYWTVELLARAVGLSRPAFARQFACVMQLSPMRYLTERRMQLAADLIRRSDAGLAEVAAEVGYQSEFAFSRAFKRHHRVSPSVFRRDWPVERSTALRAA